MPSGDDADPESPATAPKRSRNKPPARKMNSSSGPTPSSSPDERRRSIAAKSSVLLHPIVTLTCYIPTQCVGAVIGRRGNTILQIQKQAQALVSSSAPVRVSVINDSETDVPYTYSELDRSSSLWTPVVIRADAAAALAAAEQLEEIVSDDQQNEKPAFDDVVLDVPIACSKHASLVGKKGVVLANLSANTNVRIMVPRKEYQHDVIQLEGTLENVSQCLEQILQTRALAAFPKSKRQNAPERSQTSSENGVLTVWRLPPQSKLRNIARKTDTVIQKKKIAEGEWELLVTGSQVAPAIALLEKLNEEQGNKDSGRKDGDDEASPTTTSPPRPRPRTKPPGPRNNNTKGRKSNTKVGGGTPKSTATDATDPASST